MPGSSPENGSWDHGFEQARRRIGSAGGGADEGCGRTGTELQRELTERLLRQPTVPFRVRRVERRHQLPGDGVRGDLPRDLDQDPLRGVLPHDIQPQQRAAGMRGFPERGNVFIGCRDVDRAFNRFREQRRFDLDRPDLRFRRAPFSRQRLRCFRRVLSAGAGPETGRQRRVRRHAFRQRHGGVLQVRRGDRELVFPRLRHDQRHFQTGRRFSRTRTRLHLDRGFERDTIATRDRPDRVARRERTEFCDRFRGPAFRLWLLPRFRLHRRREHPTARRVRQKRLDGDTRFLGRPEFIAADRRVFSITTTDRATHRIMFRSRRDTPSVDRDVVRFADLRDLRADKRDTLIPRTDHCLRDLREQAEDIIPKLRRDTEVRDFHVIDRERHLQRDRVTRNENFEADITNLARDRTVRQIPARRDRVLAKKLRLRARRDRRITRVKTGREVIHDRTQIVVCRTVCFVREIERENPIGVGARKVAGRRKAPRPRNKFKRVRARGPLRRHRRQDHREQQRHTAGEQHPDR